MIRPFNSSTTRYIKLNLFCMYILESHFLLFTQQQKHLWSLVLKPHFPKLVSVHVKHIFTAVPFNETTCEIDVPKGHFTWPVKKNHYCLRMRVHHVILMNLAWTFCLCVCYSLICYSLTVVQKANTWHLSYYYPHFNKVAYCSICKVLQGSFAVVLINESLTCWAVVHVGQQEIVAYHQYQQAVLFFVCFLFFLV